MAIVVFPGMNQMKPTVYVETSVLSYYYDDRPNLKLHTDRTRVWWDHERDRYECSTTDAVIEELAAGTYPWQADSLRLAATLPRLDLAPEIDAIVDVYIENRLLPRLPIRDAIHVATATFHGIDFLLTWNCRHLANANKTRHLEVINKRLGYPVPQLVTPFDLQLIGDEP